VLLVFEQKFNKPMIFRDVI